MVGTRRDRPLTVVGAGRSRSVLAPPQPALEAGRARDLPRTRTTPSSGWTSFQLVPFVSRRPAPRTPRSADPQEAEERDDGAVTGAFACDVRPTIECLAVGVTEALRGVRRSLGLRGIRLRELLCDRKGEKRADGRTGGSRGPASGFVVAGALLGMTTYRRRPRMTSSRGQSRPARYRPGAPSREGRPEALRELPDSTLSRSAGWRLDRRIPGWSAVLGVTHRSWSPDNMGSINFLSMTDII